MDNWQNPFHNLWWNRETNLMNQNFCPKLIQSMLKVFKNWLYKFWAKIIQSMLKVFKNCKHEWGNVTDLGFQIIRSQGRTGPTPTYNFQQFKVQSGQTHLVHLAIILPTVTSNCLIQTRHHNIQRAKNVHHFFLSFSHTTVGQEKKKHLSIATIYFNKHEDSSWSWTSGSTECTWR